MINFSIVLDRYTKKIFYNWKGDNAADGGYKKGYGEKYNENEIENNIKIFYNYVNNDFI